MNTSAVTTQSYHNTLRTHASGLDERSLGELETVTNELIGRVFFGTLLREFRSGLDKGNPLTGGQTGAIFAGRLDDQLLSRLGQSHRLSVTRSMSQSWLEGDSSIGRHEKE